MKNFSWPLSTMKSLARWCENLLRTSHISSPVLSRRYRRYSAITYKTANLKICQENLLRPNSQSLELTVSLSVANLHILMLTLIDDERHDAMILDDSAKRSRSETIPPETIKQDKPRPQKTRRIKSKSAVFPEDSIMPNASFSSQVEQEDIKTEKRVTHMLASRSEWEKWFRDAFAAIQQLGCRTMAKEWIKIIHPKKQSTHPYNGKKVKAGIGNPESTKPPYWPKDVPHKEPDHINKEGKQRVFSAILPGLTLMSSRQNEITPFSAHGHSSQGAVSSRRASTRKGD